MIDIIEASGAFWPFLSVSILPMVAIFTRLSGMLLLLPGLSARVIPVRARLIAALAVCFLITPTVLPVYAGLEDQMIAVLAMEAMIGLFLGLSARLYVFMLNIVGAIIAQAMSLSQIFGAGVTEEGNTTITTLLTTAGAVLFLTSDLDELMIAMLVHSFVVISPIALGQADFSGEMARQILERSGAVIALAISFATPFILMNLTYNMILGVMNRAMPQLMVTFVGLPAITLSGIGLLIFACGLILLHWLDLVKVELAGLLS